MKTNYFIMAMLLLLSVTSCSTYYRMSSRIEAYIEKFTHRVIQPSLQEIRHTIHFCFNQMPTGN